MKPKPSDNPAILIPGSEDTPEVQHTKELIAKALKMEKPRTEQYVPCRVDEVLLPERRRSWD